MAARFAVATGNWADDNTWSATDGGAPGASFPVAGDDATIKAAVTVTVASGVPAECATVTINHASAALHCNAGSTVSGAVTLTAGTLNTNGQTCTWGSFSSSNSNARTITLGASAIAITTGGGANGTWDCSTSGSLTITANTATVTMSAAGAIISLGNKDWNGMSLVMGGSGTVFVGTGGTSAKLANLTRTGTAVKTDILTVTTSFTITATVTLGGNTTQGVNRLLVQSNTVGAQRTITAAAYVITGDVDFMDINLAYSGGASWTNVGSAFIGDCGGNSGAVTTNATASVAQTATGTASFTWSTHGWTTRVPLPQDDVSIPNAFVAGRTVTADMPRLGRNVVSTCTGSPTLSLSNAVSVYGSLDLTGIATFSGAQTVTFAGRSAGLTVTSAGLAFPGSFTFDAPGGAYTLVGAFAGTATSVLSHNNGTLTATGNVTIGRQAGNNNNTRTLNMGTGIWSLTFTGTVTVWNETSHGGLTLNAGSATIQITSTDSGVTKSFAGGGLTYGTLRHVATGTAALTITGNNTVSLDLDSSSARTVTIPTGTSVTIPPGGRCKITGLITLASATPGTKATIDALRAVDVNVLVPLSSDIALLRSSQPGSRWRR